VKLSNVKISSRTAHQLEILECKQISEAQAFRSTQQSNIIHSENFCCITPNWGCRAAQKVGAQLCPLLQRGTATPAFAAFN